MALARDAGGLTDAAPGPAAYCLEPDGRLHYAVSVDRIDEALRTGAGRIWVDIDSRRDAEWNLLSELFRFHPLAVEDTRSPDCRVKLEEYQGYLFLVVRGIHFAEATPDPYDLETQNLYLFLGPNYLVTVHAGATGSIEEVAERLDAGPEPIARGVDHLAYAVVDALVDLYFPLLDRIDEYVDELEEEIFNDGRTELSRILELKRTLVSLRRHLAPMRETMSAVANRPNPLFRQETQIYFRDVHDHVIRQLESVETYRELLTSAMEAQLSLASNRMNEIIKTLSVIATVVLPPTLVASVYGMNFGWMPGLASPYGFWYALAAMVVISGVMLLYLRRKGWL